MKFRRIRINDHESQVVYFGYVEALTDSMKINKNKQNQKTLLTLGGCNNRFYVKPLIV